MQSQSRARWLGMVTQRGTSAHTQRGVRGPVAVMMSPAQNVCPCASERRSLPTGRMSYIISVLVFTGCTAAYTPPPLTTQHPAHPEAMAAPEPPRSHTLAYGPSDRPATQPAMAMMEHGGAMAQHGGQGAQPSAQGSQQTFVGEGKVIAVVPSSGQIVVDHKAIPGFMDAMTMGYRTTPPSLLEGVKAGDTIHFTIDPQQKAIVNIENMAQREMSPGGHSAPASAQQRQPSVVGEGKVIAVVPSSSQIVVDHKEIPGFMEAMTMGYRIEPASLLGRVKAGDTIRFTIDPQQKAIVKIEKLKQ
jgi:Cu/Ag efflux protein CusF